MQLSVIKGTMIPTLHPVATRFRHLRFVVQAIQASTATRG